jgi:hypothetical protein
LELPSADRPATFDAFMFKACQGKNVRPWSAACERSMLVSRSDYVIVARQFIAWKLANEGSVP